MGRRSRQPQDQPDAGRLVQPQHIVHGLLFYGLLWLAFRRWPVEWRFVTAVLIEAAWELTENTPMVIDRYRATTAALGYSGDSVINSMSDILMMALGFLAARKLPVWAIDCAADRARGRSAARHPRQSDVEPLGAALAQSCSTGLAVPLEA